MKRRPGKMYQDILQKDLYAFLQRSFLELHARVPFHHNWHLAILAAKLREVAEGKCRRLVINIPPRHLKSITTSIAFPAWFLGLYPENTVLSVCYGQDLADNLARQSRAIMQSSFYQEIFDTRISPERQAVADFETTAGGGRFATSVGGVLTGRGADIIIIDDPLKADDALSETKRKAVNEWFGNTLHSRLNNQETGAIIIVMQRLHADDLVAHVTENEDWEVLSFPAVAEEDTNYTVETPYGVFVHNRKAGDILQPALLPAEILDALRRNMQEYNFAAQYQQKPQPRDGNIVKRSHLHFYKESEKPERFPQIIQSWDTANKTTELANYSVCTTWGWDYKKLYLLGVHRQKMEFPELQKAVKELADLWGANVVLIEDKASGTALIQQLKAEGFNKVEAAPPLDGDKVMRLSVQTARISGGFVLFPEEAPWLQEYLEELTAFPNGKNDDQVDSTVYAIAWATEKDSHGVGWFTLGSPVGSWALPPRYSGPFR